MRKKVISIFFLIVYTLILSLSLYGQSLESHFKEANEFYKKGSFKEALSIYEKIENQGMYSAELYYNMSNTFFRLDDFAMAVVYNEKAYKLAPRNENIRYNKKYFNIIAGQKSDTLYNVATYITFNELVSLTLFVYIIFFIFLFISRRYYPRWIYWTKVISFSLFICFTVWSVFVYKSYYSRKYAVVNNQESNVYSGPSTEDVVGFTVPLGRKVKVTQFSDEWVEIAVKEQGLKGWIEKEYLVLL